MVADSKRKTWADVEALMKEYEYPLFILEHLEELKKNGESSAFCCGYLIGAKQGWIRELKSLAKKESI